MLRNARVTAFTVAELLRENQQGVVKLPPSPSNTHTHTQININDKVVVGYISVAAT